jgi:hypothetical protein
MLGTAGKDLGHEVLKLGKHGIAGGFEDSGMELHIKPKELLLLAALAR